LLFDLVVSLISQLDGLAIVYPDWPFTVSVHGLVVNCGGEHSFVPGHVDFLVVDALILNNLNFIKQDVAGALN